MPPAPDYAKIVRNGLKVLTRGDTAALRAAVPLDRFEDLPDPPTPAELLERFTFDVDGRRYHGRMTQAQYDYLRGKTKDLKTFADAALAVLRNVFAQFAGALEDLNGVLGAPGAFGGPGGGPIPQPVGCCTVDGQQIDNVTEATCLGPLGGSSWSENPCPPGQPPPAKKGGRRGAR